MKRLLDEFANVFDGSIYRHRVSHTGDVVASYLYEDMYKLGHSRGFCEHVDDSRVAVNTGNQIKGKKGRRGDGTFGRVVPSAPPNRVPGFTVPRGLVANLEIGAEFKIGATKLIAQVDRVINDLIHQARVFSDLNGAALRVAFVGVNFADSYLGHEGERTYEARVPPSREAADFASRIETAVRPHYDEVLVLRFKATNKDPYGFEWVNYRLTEQEYTSALVRLSAEYQRRFG